MSSRLPESYAQKNRFFNCRDQLCVNLDTGELIPQLYPEESDFSVPIPYRTGVFSLDSYCKFGI